jgi:dTDP-glucose 4,6-dehydratase
MSLLITGGCGFIGSNFIHRYLSLFPDETVINVDKLTYAGNIANLNSIKKENYHFVCTDINDRQTITQLLTQYRPNCIVHMAAESHVDRSIVDSTPFIKTNVLGTLSLLDAVKNTVDWDYKFIHVSTDEVYGSLSLTDPPFTETTTYNPRSPYSASKASSDHLVNAYHHTYGMNTIITNCSNNYGSYQYPEKFIPVIITKALRKESIPVYGQGSNIRDWLHVLDHCDALIRVLENGVPGEKYNIGGNCQIDNLSLAKMILDYMEISHDLLTFVTDRKGHDFRYDIDNNKIFKDLGWTPSINLNNGLAQTIDWYIDNLDWIKGVEARAKNFRNNISSR